MKIEVCWGLLYLLYGEYNRIIWWIYWHKEYIWKFMHKLWSAVWMKAIIIPNAMFAVIMDVAKSETAHASRRKQGLNGIGSLALESNKWTRIWRFWTFVPETANNSHFGDVCWRNGRNSSRTGPLELVFASDSAIRAFGIKFLKNGSNSRRRVRNQSDAVRAELNL